MRVKLAAAVATFVMVFVSPAAATVHLQFRGQAIVPTGTTFEGTTVGGLSSITYDASRDAYYALSDDPSQFQPVRHYTVGLAVHDGRLTKDRRLIFTSEGVANNLIDPFVRLVSDNNFAATQFTQFLLFTIRH